MNRYIQYSMTYGFLRAVPRVFEMRDGDTLPGTKIACVAIVSAAAPWLFPVYLYNDTNRFYMSVKGIPYERYGYNTKDQDVRDILYE